MTLLLTLFGPLLKSLLEMVVGKTVDGFQERSAAKADTLASDAKIRSIAEAAEAERRIQNAMRLGHDISTPDAWNKLVQP